MDLYSDDMTFNSFYDKKKRDLKILNVLNDFVKPNPYFVYYMFKDTIHVDDYGSIKETLFKFPSTTKVILAAINCINRILQIRTSPSLKYFFLVMMSIQRFLCAMI